MAQAEGITLNPLKAFLIVHPDNLKSRKLFGSRHWFKVWTGAHYLGGYIRDDQSKRDCLKKCTDMWEQNIYTISKSAGKYPQERYVMVLLVIQTCHKEYRRRVYGSGEDCPGNIFASTLFGKSKTLSPIVGTLTTILIKKAGLGLLDPVTSANKKWLIFNMQA